MNAKDNYSRPIGFAEAVRNHGDLWRYYGSEYAKRIGDSRLHRAFILSGAPNSSDFHDGFKMSCYTRRIYSYPINQVRGAA